MPGGSGPATNRRLHTRKLSPANTTRDTLTYAYGTRFVSYVIARKSQLTRRKDAEGPQSFVVKLGADRTFALDGNQGLREALGRNYDGCVLVWERSRTDWKRYALDERVGVPDDDHTVLMRIPDLLGLPYLGVEMCAQELKVDWVIVEDPRHPENHGGRAARQPLEMQNPVKQEVDIDLVAEEEREISTRLAEATIREDDRVLLDVDLFCNL